MLAAHGAEVGFLMPFFGKSFVMKLDGFLRIQCQMELVLPTEFKPCLAHGIVPEIGCRVSLGEVCGMRCQLEGNHPFLYIVTVWQSQMLFLGHIAQHCRTEPTYHGSPNGRRNVVVPGGYVRYERTERIEWCPVAILQLEVHVLLDFVHGHMSRSFDERLHIVLPGNLAQFAQGLQFFDLRLVVGVSDATGAQSVTQ